MAATFVSAGVGVGTLGFDGAATPPWVMIPEGGSRDVRLTGGNGLSLRLKKQVGADLPTIRETSSDSVSERTIQITGKSAGTSLLEASNANGQVLAKLEINVRAKLVITTTVFFLFEQNGRTCRSGLSTAENMIDVANKLYLPQTNIELRKIDSGPIRLPFNMDRGMPGRLAIFNVPRSFVRQTPGPLPWGMPH